MLLGILFAMLPRLFGGGFTPTDMTSPPAFGTATGRMADVRGFDARGDRHLSDRFGRSVRCDTMAPVATVGLS